jgi:hypothetical protein
MRDRPELQSCNVKTTAPLQNLARATAVAVFTGAFCALALSSEPSKRSGYAIGTDRCGSGTLSFPRIQIDMKKGFCAGLVASEEDDLRFPRSIVQIPGREQFVISDMGGWNRTDGRLLMLDPGASEGKRIKEAVTGLEYPFGLAIGPDKKVYASTAEMIFRFDPLASNPQSTIETIIQDLPGRRITLPDGTKIKESSHSLKHFILIDIGLWIGRDALRHARFRVDWTPGMFSLKLSLVQHWTPAAQPSIPRSCRTRTGSERWRSTLDLRECCPFPS